MMPIWQSVTRWVLGDSLLLLYVIVEDKLGNNLWASSSEVSPREGLNQGLCRTLALSVGDFYYMLCADFC